MEGIHKNTPKIHQQQESGALFFHSSEPSGRAAVTILMPESARKDCHAVTDGWMACNSQRYIFNRNECLGASTANAQAGQGAFANSRQQEALPKTYAHMITLAVLTFPARPTKASRIKRTPKKEPRSRSISSTFSTHSHGKSYLLHESKCRLARTCSDRS